ncbi:Choline transport ATP-binding protein OpuBA [Thalassoglobus neptunius]|uniref:Choline transport ATP-binding protein OpuBA n=1 Tax=Thalassoglobus neptunius TaxID=1938619 RepID=A0A5C5W9Q3_9PLAN|nr:ATP-binding cassette domain-containing protein [Thalassoglobus neptunius]TWT46362.1 Choline transport ATP-binding protein OpuBA [Thalassoglobus neptunius]
MLRLTNVSKTYDEKLVLAPTSIEFPQGKTSVLLGTSGCGKSTLLRLMISLVEPDAGEILFNGKPLTRNNIAEIRHRIGYMIQDGGLFPHFTVEGNVALLAKHLGWNAQKIRDRMQELLELVHLDAETLTRYPRQISGGQRQRVALMRALFLDPDVLLLDEPMGALDPVIRSNLQEELRGIFRTLQKTVVLVTHDIGEAAYLGDSISVLNSGRVLQTGTFEDLLNNPTDSFVTDFIRAQRTQIDSVEELI